MSPLLRSKSVNPQQAKANMKPRYKIPYDAIEQDLKRHKGTVVYDIKRQAANRAEKRLTRKLGFRIEAYPYLEAETKKRGYLFARPEDIGD